MKSPACEDPSLPEVFDCVVQGCRLPAQMELKSHPADFFARGRVRVALRGADGLPLNPEIPDRKALFLKVAELLPQHPERSPEAKARRAAAEAAARAAAMKSAQQHGGGGSGGSGSGSGSGGGGSGQQRTNKKKGKK